MTIIVDMLYSVKLLNKPVQQLKQHNLLVLYDYAKNLFYFSKKINIDLCYST